MLLSIHLWKIDSRLLSWLRLYHHVFKWVYMLNIIYTHWYICWRLHPQWLKCFQSVGKQRPPSAIVPSCEGVSVDLPRQVGRHRFCWFIVRARTKSSGTCWNSLRERTALSVREALLVLPGKWCCRDVSHQPPYIIWMFEDVEVLRLIHPHSFSFQCLPLCCSGVSTGQIQIETHFLSISRWGCCLLSPSAPNFFHKLKMLHGSLPWCYD